MIPSHRRSLRLHTHTSTSGHIIYSVNKFCLLTGGYLITVVVVVLRYDDVLVRQFDSLMGCHNAAPLDLELQSISGEKRDAEF
jgi:hypothetical protein